MSLKRMVLTSALIAAAGGAAIAGSHGGNPAVKARQAHMQLYAHNIGILGAMAKGEAEYDAEAATTAANNLVALSGMAQNGYWVEGTSNEELGEATRALPAIIGNQAEAAEHFAELNQAAMSLAEVAGNGQEAIGPALGPVGQACGDCHDEYRQPNN